MFQYFQCIKLLFQNIGAYGNYKKSVPPVSAFLQTWFFVYLSVYASVLVKYYMGISSA